MNNTEQEKYYEKKVEEGNKMTLPLSIVVAGIFIAGAIVIDIDKPDAKLVGSSERKSQTQSFELPIVWGDLGKQMVENGTIDDVKFREVYSRRGWTDDYERLLSKSSDSKLKINEDNAGLILNLLWALGLSSKNEILETGEMVDPRYGGAERFASTAGWTIAKGSSMNHYSSHRYFDLTPEEQKRVDDVSKTIFRPCCSNSAHFPDCNHGMAMLGLLELMASQGSDEVEMKKIAAVVNSYWFPTARGGGCGVGGGTNVPAQKQQSGCDI